MEDNKIKLYARVENGVVTRLLNTIFNTAEVLQTDILIGEGYGDDYAHPQTKYSLLDDKGCHNYKIVKGKMVDTTAVEKQTELDARPVIVPTPTDEQTMIANLAKEVALLKAKVGK